jgi:hypothetical protein
VDRATKLAVAGDLSCAKRTLPSVQQAANVDAKLAGAVVKATALASDRETADAAWMVLGTVELRARLTGAQEIARSVDGRIAAELRRRTASGVDTTALLEAAGNGGCEACTADVERAMKAKDARTRRIAAGALRFSEHQGSVAEACRVLRTDADETVRAHVAWSLGWSRLDLDARVACLREAALKDTNEGVRTDAARALDNLGATDADPRGE